MTTAALRVGAVAHRSGVTVRTLHYYDQIGLLSPSARTPAGHRLYTAHDLARLQQIRSLQQMGLRLEEIAGYLQHGTGDPLEVIALHLERIETQLAALVELRDRLRGIERLLERAEEPDIDMILKTIEVMQMIERYYTTDQLEKLAARRRELGEAHVAAVEAEWPQLIARMQAAMAAGADPASAEVQVLARRWQELVADFTGGDPGIAESLQRLYAGEPEARQQAGIDPELFAYVDRAVRASDS